MTAKSAKRPNGPVLAIGGLLAGAGMISWFALGHFIVKWSDTGPLTPTGDFIYAHVEHGRVIYFDAMQSTGSHLLLPSWFMIVVGILISNAAYGEGAFRRTTPTWSDLPGILFQLAGAVLAIAAIYYFGHDILNAFVDSPFRPSSDDLSLVKPN